MTIEAVIQFVCVPGNCRFFLFSSLLFVCFVSYPLWVRGDVGKGGGEREGREGFGRFKRREGRGRSTSLMEIERCSEERVEDRKREEKKGSMIKISVGMQLGKGLQNDGRGEFDVLFLGGGDGF